MQKDREIQLVRRQNCQIAANEKKKIIAIPIVAGALGPITKNFEKYIESLSIVIRIEHVEKSALLGTAKIIWKVLSC